MVPKEAWGARGGQTAEACVGRSTVPVLSKLLVATAWTSPVMSTANGAPCKLQTSRSRLASCTCNAGHAPVALAFKLQARRSCHPSSDPHRRPPTTSSILTQPLILTTKAVTGNQSNCKAHCGFHPMSASFASQATLHLIRVHRITHGIHVVVQPLELEGCSGWRGGSSGFFSRGAAGRQAPGRWACMHMRRSSALCGSHHT